MRFLRVVAVAFVLVVGGGLVPVAAAAEEATVRISAGLDPAELSVAPGTTVRWVNDDVDRHRVRSTGDGPTSFDSGNLEPGEAFTFTFTAAGRTAYVDDRDRANAAYHGAVTVAQGGASPAPATGRSPTPAPAPPATATITMADRAFSPASVVVAPGATITWTNRDDRDHTGTADGGAFDTGDLGTGATATTTHPDEGTFAFRCDLHPDMTGVVRVSSASGTPAPPPPPAPAPAPASSPAPSASPPPTGPSTHAVQMGDLFFSPATLDLRVGDTVAWSNAGRAPHTATGGSFDSGRVAPGATFRWTATEIGTVPYGCTIHAEMTGQLRVLAATAPPPPPAPAPAAAPQGSAPPSSAPPAAPPAAPRSATVDVQDFAFAPASVTIAAGGTVAWTFTGAAPHTATGDGFDSGVVDAGATFEHPFATPGTFGYSCTVHPDMKGEVVVLETALIAETSEATLSPPTRSAEPDATQAWTVALLGGAAILGGTGALLLGARRFLLAS